MGDEKSKPGYTAGTPSTVRSRTTYLGQTVPGAELTSGMQSCVRRADDLLPTLFLSPKATNILSVLTGPFLTLVSIPSFRFFIFEVAGVL